MGVFGEYAAEYLDRNIPVIPTWGDDGKRPCVKNWNRMGITAARDLHVSGRFDDANLAFLAGQRSGITVLDVDSPDRKALNAALSRFGDTPVIIQTGSGKYQAWYRHNGEKRLIRPIENIDILGSGICVAPPSIRPDLGGTAYEWLSGDLDDITDLPCMENLPESMIVSGARITKGNRTDDLFRELRKIAMECETIEELALRAEGINASAYDPPLSTAKVRGQVKGVWKLKEEGRCIVPGSNSAVLPLSDTLTLSEYPPALVLLSYLRAHHVPSHVFVLSPKGIAEKALSMSHVTVARARDFLQTHNKIQLVQKGPRRHRADGTIKTDSDLYRLLPG